MIETISTPTGQLYIGAKGSQIYHIGWHRPLEHMRKADEQLLQKAKQQLHAYFSGKRTVFELPLLLEGTLFQQRVWQALQRIPFGTLATYQEIANAIGQPSAVRAVANAIGANPVVIVVPCHRVIGKNGTLTGFSGGLEKKHWLLTHEGHQLLPAKQLKRARIRMPENL